MNSGTQAVMSEIEKGMENRMPYYKFEYPPSAPSEEDTESIYSIQDKETDFVQDSSDSEVASSDEVEVSLEYDVASLSEDDENMDGFLSSSGTEDYHEVAIAAVLVDSSLEAWATDGETSDSSSAGSGDFSFVEMRKDFWTCVQCKLQKDNPLFRYCDKCFQQRCWQCKTKKSYKCFPLCENCFKVRKTLFPPPPRGNRKRKLEKTAHPRVQLDTLQTCLKNLKQDPAQNSNEGLTGLDFNKIIVPEHLRRRTTTSESSDTSDEPPRKFRRTEANSEAVEKSDSGFSEVFKKSDDARPDSRLSEATQKSEIYSSSQSDILSQPSSSSGSVLSNPSSDIQQGKDLCIMCNAQPKDAVFIHSRVGHMCCCYSCSMKTWRINKKCPLCNCKVSNVVQLFTV